MSRGTFDDVPLTVLFPHLSAADLECLGRAARAVDAARATGETVQWEWELNHAVFPDGQPGTPVVLGVDVVAHAEGGDQLEFLLQVVWADRGRPAVDAAVNVACWCETDHGTHDVDALSLVVDEETPLPEAFATAAERVTGWLADPRHADYWRDRAALPSRWR
ncbi:hypothetical protein [Streptomyces sp. Amel2xC10]|uniref:hypothetical protein n=1 Tax=Streptomyces sp. Amel2xC10 TaxID=1305826 RepID=UPI00211A1069|nr:hypothetical protein [Streptomyces sp. Amel2xC10]